MAQDDKALTKALDWVVKIDPPAIIASVKSESESSPHASNGTKVDKVFHVKWELLLLVFGLSLVNQFLGEIGVRGGMGVTRGLIKKYISKETIKQFQEIMLKYFGIKVTQKAIITKTLPNIGVLFCRYMELFNSRSSPRRNID